MEAFDLTHSFGRYKLWAFSFALLAFAANCGGDDDDAPVFASGGTDSGSGGSSGTTGQDSAGEANGDNGTAGQPTVGELSGATQLVPGAASLAGTTTNGWAILRDGTTLKAKEIGSSDEPEIITETVGTVLIKGSTVFNWADVDWEESVGELSVWTRAGGTQEIGSTRYAESLVAASASGDFFVYPANVESGTLDLMLASNDFETDEVLIEGVGLSSEETCAPIFNFVGERLIVGWCEEGTRDARIERFDLGDDGWESTLIADDALATWSADASGDRIFYQGKDYAGYFHDGSDAYRVDGSVSRGYITPDGSAVLYTVADQLRRSPVPEAAPLPIVTTGFAQIVSFSADYGHALYSSKITYENGTQRDLKLATTADLNPEPIVIVSDPTATMGRSSMSAAGNFIFYLTDVTRQGGTMHVVDLAGNEVLTREGVVEVAATTGDAIVFSENSTDPEVYPVLADLKYLDLATGVVPQLIESVFLDGRTFQVDATKKYVLYRRSGVGRDAAEPERDGVFWVALPE